jgi:hypothetical protein
MQGQNISGRNALCTDKLPGKFKPFVHALQTGVLKYELIQIQKLLFKKKYYGSSKITSVSVAPIQKATI